MTFSFAVDLICEEALPLNRLHQSCDVIIGQGHAPKLLSCLFKLVVSEKGPNFLAACWNASGLAFDNFMEANQVEQFVKDNVSISGCLVE